MIVKKSRYAKEEYLYYRLHCSEICILNFSTPERVLIGSHRNKNKYYIKAIHASFDIETTRIKDTDNSISSASTIDEIKEEKIADPKSDVVEEKKAEEPVKENKTVHKHVVKNFTYLWNGMASEF